MLELKQLVADGLAGLAVFKCIPGTDTCIEAGRRERIRCVKCIPVTNTCIKVGRWAHFS